MESRTKNSIRNSFFNIANQSVSVLLQFVLRTVFIKCLTIEYLGVGGLFTSILGMLSLTDLGIGAAIVCSMYRPLAEKNTEEINKYFNIYRRIYTAVGIIISVIGLALLPLLPVLIKDYGNVPNLEILYILFLCDSVASYFFAHYRSLLTADQKDYINANNRTLFLIFQTAAQILFLYITHNYIVFLIIKILFNILSGYVLSLKVRKHYPFIRRVKVISFSSEAVSLLKKDTVGVFTSNMASTVLNGTDTLIISAFLGSVITGYYSNYSLIVGTVSTVIGLIFSSVQASIGNYCVSQNIEEQRTLFFNLQYMYFVLYGFCTICLWGLISPFIRIWLGESFLLEYWVVAAIIAKFFFSNMRQTVLNFLTVNHLLHKLFIKNVIEVLINLTVSIWLVKRIGIAGIFVGTCVGMAVTSLWFEPLVLFRSHLGSGLIKYYLRCGGYSLAVLAGCMLTNTVDFLRLPRNIGAFVIRMLAVLIIAGITVILPFCKTAGFRFLKKKILTLLPVLN